MAVYVIAVLIAPLAAIVEHRTAAISPFAWEDGVWFWWVLRVGFEMFIAAAVVVAVGALAGHEWAPAVMRGLLIGACVPAITRSYFVAIGQEQGTQKIGAAHFYDVVVAFLGGRISDIETEAESSWAHHEAYPVLFNLGWRANTLAFRLADVAERRLAEADFAAFKEELEGTLREPTSNERKLRETIAHGRSVKAHRTLRRIVKDEQQPPTSA